MRENVRDRDRLEHIVEAIDRILAFADGKTKEELEADDLKYYAYTAVYDNANSQLTLTKLGTDIPAATAVIIVSATRPVTLAIDGTLGSFSGDNDLRGVDVRTEKSTLGTGTFYVMGKKNGEFGFFEYTGTYMPASKAYLLLPVAPSEARGLTMVFADDNGSAGVSPATVADGDVRAPGWHTLDGRRLAQKPATKGLYILNGKKVMVK